MTETHPVFDPSRLAAHTEGLRALARSLLRDEHGAEDVVQEALVAALHRPPRVGTPLRPWLVGVVRNIAFKSGRGERRRRAREQSAARPEAVEPAADAVARGEEHRLLVEALLSLSEPYRSALLLRYLDGLRPVEIAAHLGLPPATVRTHVHRGLELLRERLSGGHGGDARAWRAALLPLMAAPASRDTARTAAASTTGAFTMASIGKWTIAALAAAGLAIVWWSNSGETRRTTGGEQPGVVPEVETSVGNPVRAPRADARSKTGGASEHEQPSAPGASEPEAKPEGLQLRGRLTANDESVPDGATLHLHAIPDPTGGDGTPRTIQAITDQQGRFGARVQEFLNDDPHVAEVRVRVVHADYMPFEARVHVVATKRGPMLREVAFELVRAITLPGRVTDRFGAGVGGAHVATFLHDADHDWEPSVTTTCDPAGRFRIRVPPGARGLVAATDGTHVPTAVEFIGRPGTLPMLSLADGAVLAGRVIGPSAEPLVGVNVITHCEWLGSQLQVGPHTLTYGGGRARHWRARGKTGDDGAYRIEGLAEEPHSVRVTHYSIALDLQRADALEGQFPEPGVDIQLVAGRLIIEVRRDGNPVQGASVHLSDGMSANALGTRPDGRVSLLTRPDGGYTVSIAEAGLEPEQRVVQAAPAGGEHVERFDLVQRRPRPSLEISFRGPGAEDIGRAGIGLYAESDDGHPKKEATTQRTDDRFGLNDLEPGRYRLLVQPGAGLHRGQGYYLPIEDVVDLPSEGVLRRTFDVARGGRLRVAAKDAGGGFCAAVCRVTDASERVVNRHFFQMHEHGWQTSASTLFEEGVSDVVPVLPPGQYRVEFAHEGFAPKTVTVDVREGETTELVVQLDAL